MGTTDRVMTVSFHKYGEYFPGTGDLRDIGAGKGKYYAVNFPMRDGIDDDSYQNTFVPIVSKVMESYQPSAVVLQCGADSLSGDRLGCFNLTLKGHAKCVEFMKKYNLTLMLLGGGGYTIRNVARCWTYETAVALNVEIANELPYNDYFEYFGPDFKLHISPSNMANQNTPEYMDKIKTRLFENLRMLPHAPGVQMANIPDDGIPGVPLPKDESEVLDEANPDKRLPQQIKDKIVEADNEFEDSTKSGNKNETDSSAAPATSNDVSSKTKGAVDNALTDTATKKTSETTEATKGSSGKDEKEEPMDIDSNADKDDKSKNGTKASDSSVSTASSLDSKSSTKEAPSVTAS